MEASTTVMSKQELSKINDAMPSTAKYGEVFLEIANKQAEISFKAGRREVIEVVDDYYDLFADEFIEKYHITEKNVDMWDAKKIIRQALQHLEKGE